jgi:hypothetical protein
MRYISRCKKSRCHERATLIADKVDGAGRHVRQIELCLRHCQIVIERERACALGDCGQIGAGCLLTVLRVCQFQRSLPMRAQITLRKTQ